MLRLFPIAIVIIALILLRLSYDWTPVSLAAVAQTQPTTQPMPAGVPEPSGISPQRKQQIEQLVRQAITFPSSEGRAAAAFAAADKSIDSLARTLAAIQIAQSIVTDNLSNADTIGFKSTLCTCESAKPVYLLDVSQGSMRSTDRSLDLAIEGEGFFAVRLPGGSGIGYTRCGAFFVNNRNQCVLGIGDGYPLEPRLLIPTGVTTINIGQDGTIEAIVSGEGAKRKLGQLQLTRFRNAEALERIGGSIWRATRTSGQPLLTHPGEGGCGLIRQGFLEASNVDIDRERLRLAFLSSWRTALEEAIAETRTPRR